MPPQPRATYRPSTPPTNSGRTEANTLRKSRFFSVYDQKKESKSLRAIAREEKVEESTARKWLRQRRNLGSLAYSHTFLGDLRKFRKSRLIYSFRLLGILFEMSALRLKLLSTNLRFSLANSSDDLNNLLMMLRCTAPPIGKMSLAKISDYSVLNMEKSIEESLLRISGNGSTLPTNFILILLNSSLHEFYV